MRWNRSKADKRLNVIENRSSGYNPVVDALDLLETEELHALADFLEPLNPGRIWESAGDKLATLPKHEQDRILGILSKVTV